MEDLDRRVEAFGEHYHPQKKALENLREQFRVYANTEGRWAETARVGDETARIEYQEELRVQARQLLSEPNLRLLSQTQAPAQADRIVVTVSGKTLNANSELGKWFVTAAKTNDLGASSLVSAGGKKIDITITGPNAATIFADAGRVNNTVTYFDNQDGSKQTKPVTVTVSQSANDSRAGTTPPQGRRRYRLDGGHVKFTDSRIPGEEFAPGQLAELHHRLLMRATEAQYQPQ